MRRALVVGLVAVFAFCLLADASDWRFWVNGQEVHDFTVYEDADGNLFIDLSITGSGMVNILAQAFGGEDGEQLLFQDTLTLQAQYLSLAQSLTVIDGVLCLSRDALIANGFATAVTQAPGDTNIVLGFLGSGMLSEDVLTSMIAGCLRMILTLDGRFLVNGQDSNPKDHLPRGILKLVSQEISGGIFTMVLANIGDAAIGLGDAEIELGFVVDPSWGFPDWSTIWARTVLKNIVLQPGEEKEFGFPLPQMPADAMRAFHEYMAFWFPKYNRDPEPDFMDTIIQDGVPIRCIQHRDWVTIRFTVNPIGGGFGGTVYTYIPCFLTELLDQ